MFAHERYKATLDLLAQKQRLTVQELQRTLRISPATLRRDLAELEREGKVVRVHGGLMHPLALQGESTFDERSREAVQVKKAMAAEAAAKVAARSTVFLDSGTTCFEVGRVLMTRKDVTLITNSIPFAHVAQHAAAKVICVGGEIRATTGALAGAFALSWLEKLHADWAFLGATGLSENDGASTTELSEAAVKQAMIRRANRAVLMADGTKWDQPAAVKFADWSEFDVWITSTAVKPRDAGAIAKLGSEVVRVKIA